MHKLYDHKFSRIIFFISMFIFLLLLSYHLSVYLIPLNSNQQQTIDFVSSISADLNELNFNYTSAELSHLNDVKKVMRMVDFFFYFSLIVIILMLTYYRKEKEELVTLLYYGGITTLVTLGSIFILSLLFFNQLFTLFHLLFFPQGNWIFPVDSLLIQTFPLDFFIGISKMIFILGLLFALLLIIFPRLCVIISRRHL
ncbi:DUF1461 domain-containing protein [Candidatus Woesearchaeota archaeon]|nr:DUF1461 domain-containing protein [Candidatus Woesearchaeota archaeon]